MKKKSMKKNKNVVANNIKSSINNNLNKRINIKPNMSNIDKVRDRTPTGIPGFDDLIDGGFPRGFSILVAGGPGTGKSILSLQYIVNGAAKYNEKGLYVSFEQRENAIKSQGSQFGWDIENLEKKGMVKIMSIPVININDKTLKDIEEFVKKENYKRLVIDSLSTLVVNAPIYSSTSDLSIKDVVGENVIFSPPIIGDYIIKRFLYSFIDRLRNLNCTSLLIGEGSQSGETITRDTLSEFACDGIIEISFESLGGEFSRSLIVRKMRKTKNNEDVHPVEISKIGIVVHSVV